MKVSFTLRQDYIAEFYLSYKDIMAFWEQKYPDRIINLNYEELVNDFQKSKRIICAIRTKLGRPTL